MVFDLEQYMIDESIERQGKAERAKFARSVKPGDKVRIRAWDDMSQEYGENFEGNIQCEATFMAGMEYLCGKEICVYEFHEKASDTVAYIDEWTISIDMIEPIEWSAE